MSDNMTDVEVLEDPETGLAVREPASPALFGTTDDPVAVVERMQAVAEALHQVIVTRGLSQTIPTKEGLRDHVRVEGWTTLGAMLGVFPVTVWTHKLDDPEGWEARVEARTTGGSVIGAAEAMCTRDERRWKYADDYAIRSMAQTRATSKAMRMPLGFIVSMAGYSETPAEEMDYEDEPCAPSARSSQRESRYPEKPRFNTNGVKAALVRALPDVPKDTLAAWWEENTKEFDDHQKNGTVTGRRCEIIVEKAMAEFGDSSPFEDPEPLTGQIVPDVLEPTRSE
jgi:hypothetical protein